MDKNDFKLSPEQKAPPRKGRRAPNPNEGPEESLDGQVNQSEPAVPPRVRKTGGWATDTWKPSKSKQGSTNLIEQQRFQLAEQGKRHDYDDDIPLIPDMEEILDEDALDVAEAPIVINKATVFSEQFDSDLNKKSTFSMLDDINLSGLTKYLHAENDLKEPDIGWSWDLLFTEVSSELRQERETKGTKELQRTT